MSLTSIFRCLAKRLLSIQDLFKATPIHYMLVILCLFTAFSEVKAEVHITEPITSAKSESQDLKKAKLQKKEELSRFTDLDRNRSRYFTAPSNLSLLSGESYFSQGILSTYGRGLSDNLTLHLRLSSLVFFMYPLFTSSLQYSFDYTKELRGGVGIAAMPWDGVITYIYKSLTFGDQDAHVTLSLGQPINIEDSQLNLTRFVVGSIGSNLKLSDSIYFVTESWVLYMLNSQVAPINALASLGFRFQGKQFAFDLGAWGVYDSGQSIPGPWLEVTWNFE